MEATSKTVSITELLPQCTKLVLRGWEFEDVNCKGQVQQFLVRGGIASIQCSLCENHLLLLRDSNPTWKVVPLQVITR